MKMPQTPFDRIRLPENIAPITTAHNRSVEPARRRKTCALLGLGVALAGSGMSAKIIRRAAKSQRDLSEWLTMFKSRIAGPCRYFLQSPQ
jgi:hypothetical protein